MKRFQKINGVEVLTKPFSKRALKAHTSPNGRISVNIIVSLDDLIGLDNIDMLNQMADERILNLNEIGSLSDIFYAVVGSVPGRAKRVCSGGVIIRVDADVSDILIPWKTLTPR